MTTECADCRQPFPHLHRHHIVARAEGGSDEESNLVPLCPNCHTLRHGGSFGRDVQREHRGRASQELGAEVRISATHANHLRRVASREGRPLQQVLESILDEALDHGAAPLRFSVHLSPRQARVFEEYRRKQGATKASLMELALVEFFAQRGVTFPEWEDRITA